MEAYEIPIVSEGMTPDGAKAALDKIHAAAAVDPSHAYMNGHHPQHRKMVDAVAVLHGIYAQREGAGMTNADKVMQEALAKQDAEKDMMRADAEAEVDKLHELGFTGDLPNDVRPHHLTTLRMQRLHAENNYTALTPLMEKELQSLRAPASTLEMFRTFANIPDADPELRQDIFEKLITWIHRANTQKYGKGNK